MPSENEFELRHLVHLDAIARHGTLALAAEILHLSQSALTKSIAKLEDSLGAPLFDRRGRRLVLNTLGQRVLSRGRDLLRRADDLSREVALHRDARVGTVRIGVGPVVALSRLPPALARFVPEHPQVRLRIETNATATLLPSLLGRELDFVIADYEWLTPTPELHVRLLAPEPIAMAVRPGHPLRKRRAVNLDALGEFPRAGASASPRFMSWARHRSLEAEAEGVDARILADVTCDNYEVLVRTVERSDMVLFGPQPVLAYYLETGRLISLGTLVDAPPSQPALLWCEGRPLSPAAEALMALFE